jgi:hypothetical protein
MWIPVLISIATVGINYFFGYLNKVTMEQVGIADISVVQEKIMEFTFASSYINTAILPLIISAFYYSDFNDIWYLTVAP